MYLDYLWGNQIAEFGVYGKKVHTFVYASDTRKRYIHMYYSAANAAGERARDCKEARYLVL